MLTIIILAALAAVGYFYIWPKYKEKQDAENKAQNVQTQTAQQPQTNSKETQWKIIDEDGLHYEGYVDADGLPHGTGKITFSDGESFEGNFNHKSPVFGTYTFADGLRYEGPVDGGYTAQGVGKVFFNSGDIYEGDCHQGTMHGMGKYRYFDEEKNEFIATYEGPMVEGKKVGQAKMTWENGITLEGIWEDDDCIRGTLRNPIEGFVYEGEVEYFQPHGKGVKTYENGEVEDGVFDNGEFL